MPAVKRKLTRKEKAAETRRRMLQAAYDLFCQHGFRATTMDDIAGAAGVAVQTLYFTFHTKDELLQAVQDWIVLGDDPKPPPMQSWYLAAVAEPDAPSSLRTIVEGVASIERRAAPMVPVFHAVAADPAGEVFRNAEHKRREGFEDLVDMLAKKQPLRRGMTRARATDLLFIVAGPECYRMFVLEAGWSEKQWIAWATATLTRDFFGEA